MIFFIITHNWENKFLIGQKNPLFAQFWVFEEKSLKNHNKYFRIIQTLSYSKIGDKMPKRQNNILVKK